MSVTITFNELPKTLEELQALPEASLSTPEGTAALAVAALCVYPTNKDEAIRMLDWLKGPQPLSGYDKQFLRDRFSGCDYVPRSYFVGASVENNYEPAKPYSIVTVDNPHASDQLDQGYMKVYLKSAGADSPRPVTLRTKPSTGQWFLWEQMLLAGIRTPAALDPWA